MASLNVLVSGASGLIGRNLISLLRSKGHNVVSLVRRNPISKNEVFWDPYAKVLNKKDLEERSINAVVNLSGESIAALRWTEDKKRRVIESRVKTTDLLARTIAELPQRPSVFVSASGVGFYGDQGDTLCNEETSSGGGFLAQVSREWERATKPAADSGVRVAVLRIAPVLTSKGGLLQQVLLPFKLGLGGPLGNGMQYFSWISLDDVINAFYFAIVTPGLTGPANTCSPNPVTNLVYTRALGKVLGRPTLIPAPAFALKALLGEMAEELMLSSTRAIPSKLQQAGFLFKYPDVYEALRHAVVEGG